MTSTRILTAAVALALLLTAMFLLPNFWWDVLLVAPLLVAGHEWARLARFNALGEMAFLIALVCGYALLLWFAIFRTGTQPSAQAEHMVYALSMCFWWLVAPCWLALKLALRNRLLLAAAGVLVLLPAWLAFARLQGHPMQFALLLGVVWIADSAAYFAGRAFGTLKLAPAISPGKTWQGVYGALFAVIAYALAIHYSGLLAASLHVIIVSFVGLTVVSIIGDLFESWIKRTAGVKDSGRCFPGHGGMLDRIDALTAALPMAALIYS